MAKVNINKVKPFAPKPKLTKDAKDKQPRQRQAKDEKNAQQTK